jgi:hypothetical protein
MRTKPNIRAGYISFLFEVFQFLLEIFYFLSEIFHFYIICRLSETNNTALITSYFGSYQFNNAPPPKTRLRLHPDLTLHSGFGWSGSSRGQLTSRTSYQFHSNSTAAARQAKVWLAIPVFSRAAGRLHAKSSLLEHTNG